MIPTDELIAHLKRFEGLRLEPYLCAAGKPTIGYGHQIPSLNHPDISEEEAEILLTEDIAAATLAAHRLSPNIVTIAPRRMNAVIDFIFNCGPGKYGASILRLRVNEERWEAAARQNDLWVWITRPSGRKVKSPWQVKRRAVTSEWLRDG